MLRIFKDGDSYVESGISAKERLLKHYMHIYQNPPVFQKHMYDIKTVNIDRKAYILDLCFYQLSTTSSAAERI